MHHVHKIVAIVSVEEALKTIRSNFQLLDVLCNTGIGSPRPEVLFVIKPFLTQAFATYLLNQTQFFRTLPLDEKPREIESIRDDIPLHRSFDRALNRLVADDWAIDDSDSSSSEASYSGHVSDENEEEGVGPESTRPYAHDCLQDTSFLQKHFHTLLSHYTDYLWNGIMENLKHSWNQVYTAPTANADFFIGLANIIIEENIPDPIALEGRPRLFIHMIHLLLAAGMGLRQIEALNLEGPQARRLWDLGEQALRILNPIDCPPLIPGDPPPIKLPTPAMIKNLGQDFAPFCWPGPVHANQDFVCRAPHVRMVCDGVSGGESYEAGQIVAKALNEKLQEILPTLKTFELPKSGEVSEIPDPTWQKMETLLNDAILYAQKKLKENNDRVGRPLESTTIAAVISWTQGDYRWRIVITMGDSEVAIDEGASELTSLSPLIPSNCTANMTVANQQHITTTMTSVIASVFGIPETQITYGDPGLWDRNKIAALMEELVTVNMLPNPTNPGFPIHSDRSQPQYTLDSEPQTKKTTTLLYTDGVRDNATSTRQDTVRQVLANRLRASGVEPKYQAQYLGLWSVIMGITNYLFGGENSFKLDDVGILVEPSDTIASGFLPNWGDGPSSGAPSSW